MKWILTLSALACAAMMATSAQAAALSRADSSFVRSAQADVLGQYALAALARSRAQSPALKALATRIAATADKADQFIKSYSRSHDVAVGNHPNVRADLQYGQIQGLNGAQFDRAFAQDVYIDASLSRSTFQQEARSGSDPRLKAFAKEQAAQLKQFSIEARKLGG
jgi:putative membrane protein